MTKKDELLKKLQQAIEAENLWLIEDILGQMTKERMISQFRYFDFIQDQNRLWQAAQILVEVGETW